jgi:hypothetical protein
METVDNLFDMPVVQMKFDFVNVLQLLMWGVIGLIIPVYMMVKALSAIQVQQLQHQVNEFNFFLNICIWFCLIELDGKKSVLIFEI